LLSSLLLLSNGKIKMDPGFRRDDGGGGGEEDDG